MKILKKLLAVILVFEFFTINIFADQAKDFEVLSATAKSVVIHSYNDKKTYELVRDGEILYIYDKNSGQLVGSAYREEEIIKTSSTMDKQTIIDTFRKEPTYHSEELYVIQAERWDSSYVEYSRGRVVFDPGMSWTTDLIIMVLIEFGGLYFYDLNAFVTLAQYIYNDPYSDVYYRQRVKYNLDCTILVKSYITYYRDSSFSIPFGSTPIGHKWLDTPWNYSYPAACRTLVNSYPY